MAAIAMLRELSIRNLAVVEEARVPFEAGLNVLTGETGAGKSILIDALLLVIGARAHPDVIRSGEESAVVEAVFDVEPSGSVAALLDESGHELRDPQLVIKRELSRAGRHRVWVNDSAATVGLLERLGDLLVEVHGQHEHQRLMEPARQLELLDRFAECAERREKVSALVRRWEEARAALGRVREELRETTRQEDLYRFQLSEIDAVQLKDGEEDELRAERTRLQHAERIYGGLQEIIALLYEEEQSAAARLAKAAVLLRDLTRFDPDAGAPIWRSRALRLTWRTRSLASGRCATGPYSTPSASSRSMAGSTASSSSSGSTETRWQPFWPAGKRSPPRSTASTGRTPCWKSSSAMWREPPAPLRRSRSSSRRRGR